MTPELYDRESKLELMFGARHLAAVNGLCAIVLLPNHQESSVQPMEIGG